MVSVAKLKNALGIYVEKEMISRISGWQKWAVGAMVAIALDRGVEMVNVLKTNPFVSALGIMAENNNIDDETIFCHLYDVAKNDAVSFNVPFIGAITLSAKDIKMLENILQSM